MFLKHKPEKKKCSQLKQIKHYAQPDNETISTNKITIKVDPLSQ